MERSNRIAQAYGYAVCFIAVITFLISTNRLIDAAFDLSAPLRAERFGQNGSLTSFERYKRERVERATRERPTPVAPGAVQQSRVYSDAELRRMFEEERAEHIDQVRFRSMRSLVSSVLMIAIASVLFLMHWRWLRRQPEAA